MIQFEIKIAPQNNGQWGMPMTCQSIDRIPRLNAVDEIKVSAIIAGVAQCHPSEHFDVYFFRDFGFDYKCNSMFFIRLSSTGWKKIILDDYHLNNNILTYTGPMPKIKN